MTTTEPNADQLVDRLYLFEASIDWPTSGVVSAPTQAYLMESDEWIDVEVTVRQMTVDANNT